jgi:hypothetical protein
MTEKQPLPTEALNALLNDVLPSTLNPAIRDYAHEQAVIAVRTALKQPQEDGGEDGMTPFQIKRMALMNTIIEVIHVAFNEGVRQGKAAR